MKGDAKSQSASYHRAGRKAATQQRILDAAMDLFARRGFERTSVTQVAAKARVSRAAVFWHFGDKATLFRESCRQFLVPFREALGGRLSHLPADKRLSDLLAVYEGFVDENRDHIETFVRWVLDSPVQARLLRDDLLELHETYRGEVEGALVELVADPKEAAALADGLVSLLDGNFLLKMFGAGEQRTGRWRVGLQAITRRILKEKERGDR